MDVVRHTGLNEGYLSELIAGHKRNPSAGVLLEIALFLDIPMQCFYRPPPNLAVLEEVADLDDAILARLRARRQ